MRAFLGKRSGSKIGVKTCFSPSLGVSDCLGWLAGKQSRTYAKALILPAIFKPLQELNFLRSCNFSGALADDSAAKPRSTIKKASYRTPFLWWERMDLNHRSVAQQIYSLPPLATRELSHIQFDWWSRWTDSNPRPADYKSAALPTELHRHWVHSQRCYITTSPSKCQAVF